MEVSRYECRRSVHKLAYIVDWLPPDYGAIGQYALQEAEDRAAAGEDVTLIGLTSGASTSEYKGVGAGRLRVIRLKSKAVDRTSFARRARWTLATNVRLVAAALGHLVRADEVLFTASPPFLEHLIVPLSAGFRGQVTFRIADLHPECLMQELARPPAWLRAFQRLSVQMRRRVDRVEVLGEDQRELLLRQGVPPGRIHLRRSTSPVRIHLSTVPMPLPDPLRGRVVLLYSGAVGHAHEVETFIRGYRRHHVEGSGRVHLWLNAEGGRADFFQERVEAEGLPIFRSRPVPLSQLASLLVAPHAHLVTLRDEYVGLVVPSKIYGCLESGRDILFIGSGESDTHRVCAERAKPGAYFRVGVGDDAGVAAVLEQVAIRGIKET